METRDIDYLLAVERHGSIGKAADALGLSQPALTKAIQRIEAQLGLTLFERTASGVIATPAGTQFIVRARRIALEYDDALKEAQAIRSGELGMVRIGYSPTVPNALVLGACRRLIGERPAAKLRLRRRLAHDLFDLLAAGELDLAIAPEPTDDTEGFDVAPLFQDRLFVLADAAHPLHRKRGVTLEDLVEQDWLLPGPTIPVRQRIDDAFRRRELPLPKLRIETDFGSTSLFRLLQGTRIVGIGGTEALSLPIDAAALDLAPGELELHRHIGAIHRKSAYLSPLAQRMIALLQEGTQ
ncbi:LysR family transcriptional regulator [Burkholderia singularis]|uniref:Hydrogen peroxide-inducible genes activator n=1 Tax=Burkholderia singularis TaxID=1503053 RepID=A0A238H6F9_9BURK|nr:LysR family transcriptional regulator [Burkholderia singularis]SMG00647.1 Hydrogen peroxide-inducible genes activator [Burkholderia singularis]